MISPKYCLDRKLIVLSFLVLVVFTSATDPGNGRWLSRRDYVFDTTGQNTVETEGNEVEFGQRRDSRVVPHKGNRPGEEELERKRKSQTNHYHSHNNQESRYNNRNHLRGKHEDNHHSNRQHESPKKQSNLLDETNIDIDADLMNHILRRKQEPKSLDYKQKKPTPNPTKKPSRQPSSMPVSHTDGSTNNNFPTVPATQFPTIIEECSPNAICYQEGLVCFSGREECCGAIHASLECGCADMGGGNLQYMCLHTEACMTPCEEQDTVKEVAYYPTGAPTIGKHSNPSLCPTNLGKSESLLNDLTLHYDVVGDNLCMRLEYDNEGWIALGFSSPDGRMVGSTAIIGLPDMKEAKYYALEGMSKSLITLLPESQQTLQEAIIIQEDGSTVLSFAKSLIDDEYISVGENTFIFAAANSNQFGYHDKRGAVTLNVSP
ncbi:hypothetical protein ACHAWT_003225 [Skeletonema menzelii]